MKTNNTPNIDFEEIIYIILLILCIIAFFMVANSIEKLEPYTPKESIPKPTYITTSTQVIDSHEESKSETIKYIDRTPNEYTITYGWFDPDKYRSK